MTEPIPTDMALADWASAVAVELRIAGDVDIDVEKILNLASVAAHNVKRPAAPLTTFLAGLAAGQAGGSTLDIATALEAASAFCDRAGEAT